MQGSRRFTPSDVRRWLGIAEGDTLLCPAVRPDISTEPLERLHGGLHWCTALLGSWAEKLLVLINVVPAVRGVLEQGLVMLLTILACWLLFLLATPGAGYDEQLEQVVRAPFLVILIVAGSWVLGGVVLRRRENWREQRCATRVRAQGHGLALLVAGEWHEYRWSELHDVARRGALWWLRVGDYEVLLRDFGAPQRLATAARQIMARRRPGRLHRWPVDLLEAPDSALSRASRRPERMHGERGLSRAEEVVQR